jgi:hypothetical protein
MMNRSLCGVLLFLSLGLVTFVGCGGGSAENVPMPAGAAPPETVDDPMKSLVDPSKMNPNAGADATAPPGTGTPGTTPPAGSP